MASVLDTVSGKLLDRFLERILGGSALFFVGGFVAYSYSRGGIDLEKTVSDASPSVLVTWLIAGLLALGGSAWVVQALTGAVLRLIEGYWPRFMNPLRGALITSKRKRWKTLRDERAELARRFENLTQDEKRAYAALDSKLAWLPDKKPDLMPTTLGNILRTSELYAAHRYGMAANLFWPRLWLHLPAETRTELETGRSRLDAGVAAIIWSCAFAVWTPWAWWAALVAVAGIHLGYRRAVAASMNFATLVEASFDLNHRSLLTALGWPLDENASVQQLQQVGRTATMFLRRGELS